jgi:hypothetical protein
MHALVGETEDHRSSPMKHYLGPNELIPFPFESGVPNLATLGRCLVRVEVRDNLFE